MSCKNNRIYRIVLLLDIEYLLSNLLKTNEFSYFKNKQVEHFSIALNILKF